MTTRPMTAGQLSRLRKAHGELTTVLSELGALNNTDPNPEPQWKADLRKQWGLLKEVDGQGGDVGSEEWGRLGVKHGYDPRGLGGFFVGSQPLMASQGARRVLTEHGRRFIERWRGDFDA